MPLQPAIVAAGHDGAMVDSSGYLFIKNTIPSELSFYETVTQSDPDLAAMMPTFMGVLGETSVRPNEVLSCGNAGSINLTDMDSLLTKKQPIALVLENLTVGFKSPTILDLKIGKVLWDDTASAEKVKRLKAVSEMSTSGSLGYRVAGMSVIRDGERLAYDKMYGRNLTEHDIAESLMRDWLPNMNAEKQVAICMAVVAYIQHLYDLLAERETRMISSSILIIYEGDKEEFGEKLIHQKEHDDRMEQELGDEEDDVVDDDLSDDGYIPRPVVLGRLVDLAHAHFTPNQGQDVNMLNGLKHAIKLMKDIAKLAEENEKNKN